MRRVVRSSALDSPLIGSTEACHYGLGCASACELRSGLKGCAVVLDRACSGREGSSAVVVASARHVLLGLQRLDGEYIEGATARMLLCHARKGKLRALSGRQCGISDTLDVVARARRSTHIRTSHPPFDPPHRLGARTTSR